MKIRNISYAVAFATAVGLAGAGTAIAESTNSQTFEGWANDTAASHEGRISRQMYMNEMGRRWDTETTHRGSREAYMNELDGTWKKADRNDRGLTPAEISAMTGKVDSSRSGVPASGTGVQPGNMGPANSKGQ